MEWSECPRKEEYRDGREVRKGDGWQGRRGVEGGVGGLKEG